MKTRYPESWFTQQIHNNQNIIHKVCSVYARCEEDRRDLYQEIVLQLWKSHTTFRGEAKFTTWMYRVAINTALTIKRNQVTSTRLLRKIFGSTSSLKPLLPEPFSSPYQFIPGI